MSAGRLAKVYWAARRLGAWWNPLGNHHFVLIMTKETILSIAPVKYKDFSFMTLGAFSVRGLLRFEANNATDVQSVMRMIDDPTGEAISNDLQQHRVAPPYGVDLWFAQGLVVRALRFDENTRARPVPYELFGDNCAAFVNMLFKTTGVSLQERQMAGQFWGIDAGERLELPEELFEEPRHRLEPWLPEIPEVPAPQPGRRTHTVKPGEWLSKIAIQYYGDMNRWKDIYKVNIDTIGKDPDMIYPGQRLIIP